LPICGVKSLRPDLKNKKSGPSQGSAAQIDAGETSNFTCKRDVRMLRFGV
jgi:hypothetical protein